MAFQIGLIGTILILGLVLAQALSKIKLLENDIQDIRINYTSLKLHMTDSNELHVKISDITKYGNSSLQEAFQRIYDNTVESQYLDDKIDTLLELLIQEHEESVK